jgi:L-fuconolactonase
MRIDAHVRFWRYHESEHRWMSPEMDPVRRDCLPAEVEPLLEQRGFDGCMALQSRHKLAETRFLLKLAESHPSIAGVIGWVDLRSRRVSEQLDEFVSHHRFKGLRHVLHDEPDDEFMLHDDFQRGLAEVGRRGLSYDVLVYGAHLPVVLQLVDAFPEQRFVLDHLGKPLVQNQLLSPWQERLRELAKREHIVGKISGLTTETDWNSWRSEDFRPYLEVALEAFGPDRLMLGSDWPMCELSGGYEKVTSLWFDFISRLSPDEQAKSPAELQLASIS